MTDAPKHGSVAKTVIICAVVLAAAAAVTLVIFNTEPTATRGGASKKTAMLVEVTGVERGDFRPSIVVIGVVEAEQDIVLSPQVGGLVTWRAPSLTPGGVVKKGEPLIRIDPRDYKNTVQQRKSALRQAEAQLALEMGRQEVARKDYELLDKRVEGGKKDLVLRKPQLAAAEVEVAAAQAALDQAELDLQRTTVRAPFAAQVLSRDVNVGSQVAPGDRLGRLVGVGIYWVVASVPLSRLRWLTFPDEDGTLGSEVRVRNRSAWPDGVYRTGRLYKLIGALEDRTRMARVLVSIDDPLSRDPANADAPPLIVGEFLETRIAGNELTDVIRLKRDLVRARDTVWVMEGDQLKIRPVTVVVRDETYAYVSEGLEADDKVVTTNLSTVTDGAKLRLEE